MRTLIILLLLNTANADSIKDVEKRMEMCLKHAEQTEDPFLKRVWTDRADIEKATILFEKKHYTKVIKDFYSECSYKCKECSIKYSEQRKRAIKSNKTL